MKCLVCRGACCEVPITDAATLASREPLVLAFVTIRGRGRCQQLTSDGQCGIYDDRPIYCRFYRPGARGCLDVVRRQRTPEQYAAIRDDADPLTIHKGE